MCNNKISNISVSNLIVNTLIKKGVKNVCISPGSRNTPLTQEFINHKGIKCYSHIDERASAYFALGIIKSINQPVAILTTSGTAAANLLPATIEASLNKSPLFLITADRPKKLMNTGASQTINQINLFNKYTRKMEDLDLSSKSIYKKLSALENIFDYALGLNKQNPPGPIHLNIRFDEPLLDKEYKIDFHMKTNMKMEKKHKPVILPKFSMPVIICGPLKNTDKLNSIIKLSEKINAPILADTLSQLRFSKYSKNTNTYYDFYIDDLKNKPDLILRFGDKPISKNLNNFINKNSKITFLIDEYPGFNDDCKNIIISDMRNLNKIKKTAVKNNLIDEINTLEIKSSKQIKNLIYKSNSQANIINQILQKIKDKDKIFIGSSTIIRTFDQFSGKSKVKAKMLSNHITRGIDGIVSSALGMAAVNNKANNYLFIGDISLFYDLNGLHILNNNKVKLTIIVINNNGGQIFSRLPYSNDNLKEFEKFWITPLKAKIKNIAKLYNLNYFKASSDNIIKVIKKAHVKKDVTLIEVFIDNKKDMNFIKTVTDKIKN